MIGDKKSQKNMMIEETIMILAEMRSRGDEFSAKISANFVPLDILLEPHLGF